MPCWHSPSSLISPLIVCALALILGRGVYKKAPCAACAIGAYVDCILPGRRDDWAQGNAGKDGARRAVGGETVGGMMSFLHQVLKPSPATLSYTWQNSPLYRVHIRTFTWLSH